MAKISRPAILVLAAVALAASVAALYVHYRLIADPTYQSFCDVSTTVSCEAVYRSSYGTMFGVPVAAGGAIWAGFVLMLAGYGMRNPRSDAAARPAGYLFLLSVVGLASVFYFAYASFFVLGKACPLCMAVYVSVIGIFLVSSSMAPSLGSLLSGVGSDIGGMVSSPNAMGLGALWLFGSLALVALFPREAILEAGTPAPSAARARTVQPLFPVCGGPGQANARPPAQRPGGIADKKNAHGGPWAKPLQGGGEKTISL